MNQDSRFTVKFHHDRYVSIRNDLGYEIYKLSENLNLYNVKNQENFLIIAYQENENIKMVEPLYLFQEDVIAVIKQNKGDILEIRNTIEKKVIYTSKPFSAPVLSFGSTRDTLLVCIETSIYIYSLTNNRCVPGCNIFRHTFESRMDTPYAVTTSSNPNGIFALGNKYYAVPDNSKSGIIKIYSLSNKYSTQTLRAHSEAVSVIAFDSNEDFIATAPKSGTVILVYHRCTPDGQPIFTFKRGNGYASISSLSFNKEYRYLACSSDRTTIHIFLCILEEDKENWWNYICTGNSERAYYTAKLPKCDMKSCLIVKAVSPIKLLVATNEGSLKLYSNIQGNERGTELTLVKEQMLDLAMCDKNNTKLESE